MVKVEPLFASWIKFETWLSSETSFGNFPGERKKDTIEILPLSQ